MLKIKGVSISLTEAKYFNVVGILTSQDGPKAIFVIGKKEGQTSVLPTPYILLCMHTAIHTFSHRYIV